MVCGSRALPGKLIKRIKYPFPTGWGRGTGFAELQAQRPPRGQRITRSEKRGGYAASPIIVGYARNH